MLQKTVYIFLIQLALFNTCQPDELNQLAIHLPKSEWIGLGFFLAPPNEKYESSFYKDCYEDQNYFMQADYQKLKDTLFTAEQWLSNGNLNLRSLQGTKLFCKVDQEGYFPELVFFKDLQDAQQNFKGKIVWSREHYFYSKDARGSVVRYPLPRFSKLLVRDISLAPISQNVSIRFTLETKDGYPGYVDMNYTAVNRKPPYEGIQKHFFTEHPRKIFNIDQENWNLILKSQTHLGMTMQEVELSLGKSVDKFVQANETVLVYPSKDRTADRYLIFLENRLIGERKSTGDDF